MAGTSGPMRGALLLRRQELRPSIPYRRAKNRRPDVRAGILVKVLVLIQGNHLVLVDATLSRSLLAGV